MRNLSKIIGAGFAMGILLWTAAGESSDPHLSAAELPADILKDCAAAPSRNTGSICGDATFRARWIGRTPRGEMFVVRRDACAPEGCQTWLVARERNGTTHTVLTALGELRLESERGKLPVVNARLELPGNYTSYTRFEWSGDQYVRTETRLVHRVDGFECADEIECQTAAQEALRQNDAGRAVRIWQQVHGINWI